MPLMDAPYRLPRLWWLLDLYTIYIYLKIDNLFHQILIAQSVEQLTSDQETVSSILTWGKTISKN